MNRRDSGLTLLKIAMHVKKNVFYLHSSGYSCFFVLLWIFKSSLVFKAIINKLQLPCNLIVIRIPQDEFAKVSAEVRIGLLWWHFYTKRNAYTSWCYIKLFESRAFIIQNETAIAKTVEPAHYMPIIPRITLWICKHLPGTCSTHLHLNRQNNILF